MRSHAHLVDPSILRHRDLASFQQRSAARVESGETLVAVTDEGALQGIAVIKPSKFGDLKQTIRFFSHQLHHHPGHLLIMRAWGGLLKLMAVWSARRQPASQLPADQLPAIYRVVWPTILPLFVPTTDESEVEQLFVREGEQGTGVGKRLLAAAERALVQSGCRDAHLYAVVGNDAAHRFYERNGWRRNARPVEYKAEAGVLADGDGRKVVSIRCYRFDKRII